MMPSFLWSTVKTQLFQPVVDTGRRNTPSELLGVTIAPPPLRARQPWIGSLQGDT
jgi:hypothetical protein